APSTIRGPGAPVAAGGHTFMRVPTDARATRPYHFAAYRAPGGAGRTLAPVRRGARPARRLRMVRRRSPRFALLRPGGVRRRGLESGAWARLLARSSDRPVPDRDVSAAAAFSHESALSRDRSLLLRGRAPPVRDRRADPRPARTARRRPVRLLDWPNRGVARSHPPAARCNVRLSPDGNAVRHHDAARDHARRGLGRAPGPGACVRGRRRAGPREPRAP